MIDKAGQVIDLFRHAAHDRCLLVDDRGRGDRGNALAPADKTDLLVGRCLDRAALQRNPQHGGQVFPHRQPMRADFRRFGDQRDIGIHDGAAVIGDDFGRMFEKDAGSCSPPLRIGRWKVVADIARAAGGKQRVRQSMQRHVRVGVTKQHLVMGNEDTTERDAVPGD